MLELIKSLYDALGVAGVPNVGDVAGLLSVLTLFLASLPYLFLKDSGPKELPAPEQEEEAPEAKAKVEVASELPTESTPAAEPKAELIPESVSTPEPEPAAGPEPTPGPEVPKVSWAQRLKNGLTRSRQEVWGKLESIMGKGPSEEVFEDLEEVLYSSDIGPQTVGELLTELRAMTKGKDLDVAGFKQFLFDFLKQKLDSVQSHVDNSLYTFDPQGEKKTRVIMVVGINGAGKTTSIGKLASKFAAQGASVVVGACDTFRAAAVEQLEVWCNRAGAKIVKAGEGADPSGVAYGALELALKEQADYCIIDTAGRLHTNKNLMAELEKCKRVLSKLDDQAPHQTLLVIDSVTGNNAIKQAEEFNKALGVTGLVLTKCDGSSKAGNAISIMRQLEVPITYVGVGESVEDIDLFKVDDYLNALLGI